MKTVRTYKSWLKKLIQFATASTLMVSASAAYSQSPTYGRTPWDGPASGAASGVIDSNQRGFGVAFRAGHIAGHTVGRRESISNIALTPYVSPVENGLLFGDSRLSMGNNGNLVWSFGSGYRHYIPELDIVVGGNGYVDYDELTGSRLKQWGVGAEILANRWEARGNAYQTYGVTSAMTGTAIDQNSVAFVGQNIQFTRINYFAEGMRGFDSEIGMLLPGDIAERLDLRLFGGGYYYEGQNIDGFAGWNSRLQADISDRVELGLNLTNDRTFNTTVSFSVALHFGGECIGAAGRDRPVGTRKVTRRGRPVGILATALTRGKHCQPEQSGGKQPQSMSSTSTFSPVTRCERAAAMNLSRSPSSTSLGAVETTPVRRSFTC